jgi:O-antigen ligase
MGLMIVIAIFTVPILRGAATGSTQAAAIPLAGSIENTLLSRGKQLSAEGRVNQLARARPIIAQRLWFGWGLGKTYVYFEPGPALFVESNLTHDIITDLLLRTGVVGAALFALSAWMSVRDGLRAWRHHPEPLAAALALGATAALIGLLSKGLVESLFEQFRLAVVIGVLLGIVRAVVSSRPPGDTADERAPKGAMAWS